MAQKNKNPRNPQSTLYRRLTRLLSAPLVNRRTQMQRRYRRADLQKFNFQSAMGLDFKKTSYNPYDNLTANIMANQNRVERYIDFEIKAKVQSESKSGRHRRTGGFSVGL